MKNMNVMGQLGLVGAGEMLPEGMEKTEKALMQYLFTRHVSTCQKKTIDGFKVGQTETGMMEACVNNMAALDLIVHLAGKYGYQFSQNKLGRYITVKTETGSFHVSPTIDVKSGNAGFNSKIAFMLEHGNVCIPVFTMQNDGDNKYLTRLCSMSEKLNTINKDMSYAYGVDMFDTSICINDLSEMFEDWDRRGAIKIETLESII